MEAWRPVVAGRWRLLFGVGGGLADGSVEALVGVDGRLLLRAMRRMVRHRRSGFGSEKNSSARAGWCLGMEGMPITSFHAAARPGRGAAIPQ